MMIDIVSFTGSALCWPGVFVSMDHIPFSPHVEVFINRPTSQNESGLLNESSLTPRFAPRAALGVGVDAPGRLR
jgi:hypothetical protein